MFVQPDFILNGESHGKVGNQMDAVRYDPGFLRPYYDSSGRSCVTVNAGVNADGSPRYEKVFTKDLPDMGVPTTNATTLRKDEWLQLDRQVVRAARARLRAWSDLAGRNSFGGFNGMGKLILEHETMSDPGEAHVDFDGMTEGRTDTPSFQLEGLPLPITHSDFWYSSRRLAVSRNSGTPLDTVMAEAAGRRVAEEIEKTLIGTVTGKTYGTTADYGQTPTVYGYTNHPLRNTKVDLTTPTGSNAATTLDEVLDMIDTAQADNHYGPYMLYHSNDWDKFMDDDYSVSGASNQTLRQRLRSVESITDVRRLDFWTPSSAYQLLLVQMTPEVARAVIGMDFTTVQWQSMGGMRLNFKVMTIQVPQIRADYGGRSGIVHATTS